MRQTLIFDRLPEKSGEKDGAPGRWNHRLKNLLRFISFYGILGLQRQEAPAMGRPHDLLLLR